MMRVPFLVLLQSAVSAGSMPKPVPAKNHGQVIDWENVPRLAMDTGLRSVSSIPGKFFAS
jgi:hypothetical protein